MWTHKYRLYNIGGYETRAMINVITAVPSCITGFYHAKPTYALYNTQSQPLGVKG